MKKAELNNIIINLIAEKVKHYNNTKDFNRNDRLIIFGELKALNYIHYKLNNNSKNYKDLLSTYYLKK